MITYLYWAAVIALSLGALWAGAKSLGKPLGGLVAAVVILVSGWLAYTFHFENVFVKRWGGVMSLTVPEGQHHLGATWKDDNLWVENYDPSSNTCEFREYSRGNLLQGRVIIKNCNPVLPVANPR
jgi:hypothetical protein